MKEVFEKIEAQIKRIQARSGKAGHTEPPMSGIDQVLVEMAIPVNINNRKISGGLTDEEAASLLNLSKKVGQEISSRF
ncbi:MAG: hypothetical protein QY322_00140 [bacterium]|nr:MAG: hypothetical protein QY322_00140 [bacterium]